jgi:hypothetical protein
VKQLYPLNFVALVSLLLFSCSPSYELSKHITDKNYYQTWTPPDGVKISNKLFYDQTEAYNTSWREYEYWTKRVYGVTSAEYKSTLPDTLVWVDPVLAKNKILCLNSFAIHYLRNPMYNSYPVVGISQKQALDFSKWRSDRVMEYILVANNIIKWDPAPNKETYFSIEKYYTGKYQNLKPDTNFKYYPSFRLPTITEWKNAIHYADSVDRYIYKDKVPAFWSDIKPCVNDTFNKDPMINTNPFEKPQKRHPIYNLRGNVGEWVSEDGISIGGGWFDKKEIILAQDTFHVNKPNAWTGFRNVCEWKQWTK